MYADIEALVLSGELFNGTSRSSSPSRSIDAEHDDPGWHDDEYIAQRRKEFNEKGLDYDSDIERREALKAKEELETQLQQSIGMGPGRTGVKGVIRDRDEAALIHLEKKAMEMEETRRKMEAANLGGKTYLEEEWEKAVTGEKADQLVMKDLKKMQQRAGFFGTRKGRFGHLREVGLKSFLPAVEEDKDVWVVLHICDPSLERCYLIDEKLARLAREYPDVKFLRARAAVLGFASLNKNKAKSHIARPRPRQDDDEDDPYVDTENEDEDEAEDFRDDDVDLDVLPTMLVYRNGELVFNWVRVDWEAGGAGVEELLRRHHILSHPTSRIEFRLPDDSELELVFSDDDI